MYAIDTTTGEARWTQETPEVVTGITLADGAVIFGTKAGTLVRVRPESGAREWAYDPGEDSVVSPCIANGIVYAVTRSAVHAVGLSDGERVWRWEFDDQVMGIGVGNGSVYGGTPNGQVRARDAQDGTETWSAQTPPQGSALTGPREPVVTPPVVTHEAVVVAAGRSLVAFAADTGASWWASPVPVSDRVRSPPTLHGDTILVHTQDGLLHAINNQPVQRRLG